MGRLRTHFESGEVALQTARQPLPPAIAVLIFILAFFALVFGSLSIYSGELVLGVAIFVTAFVLSLLLLVYWRTINRYDLDND
jgi:amino acid permease